MMQAAIEDGDEVLLTINLFLFLISSFKIHHFACSNSLITLCHIYRTVEKENKDFIVCINLKRELLRTYYTRADTDELVQKKYGNLLRDVFISKVISLAFTEKYGVHLPEVPVEYMCVFTVTIALLYISVLKTHRQLLSAYGDEIGKGVRYIDELIHAMIFTLELAQAVASYDRADIKEKLLFLKTSRIQSDRILEYGSTHPVHIADNTQSVKFDSGLRKKKLTDDRLPQIPNPSVCVKDKAGKSPTTCDESSDKDKAVKSPTTCDESSDKNNAVKSPTTCDESSEKDKAVKSPTTCDESSDKDKAVKSPPTRDESSDKDKALKSPKARDDSSDNTKEPTEQEDLDAISQNAEDAVTHAVNDLNIIARFKQTESGPSQLTGPPPNVRRPNNSIDNKCETTTKRDSVRSYIPIANSLNEKLREIQRTNHEQIHLSTRIPANVTPRTKPDLLPGYDWLIARFIPRDTRPHRPSTPPLNPNTNLALTGELLRQRMSQQNYRIASMVHLPWVRLLDMSAAGLYLDEGEDVFRCFLCFLAVPRNQWPEAENPSEVHRRMSPDCPLVNADAQHAEGRQLSSSEEGREGVDAARDHNAAQDLEEVGEEEGAPGDRDNPAEDSGYGRSLAGPLAEASIGCPPHSRHTEAEVHSSAEGCRDHYDHMDNQLIPQSKKIDLGNDVLNHCGGWVDSYLQTDCDSEDITSDILSVVEDNYSTDTDSL